MKFFQNQKVDQVGITAVSLQKILIFLMILSLFSLFNGGFLSFILCMIGFVGAYRRSPGLLTAYFTISISLIILGAIIGLGSSVVVYSDSYSSEYSSSDSAYAYNTYSSKLTAFTRSLAGIGSESSSESSNVNSESSSWKSSESSESSFTNSNSVYTNSAQYDEEDYSTGLIFLLFIVLVTVFFIVYCKIYSLVLAWRLRKLILCAATDLPTAAPQQSQQVHEYAPANTSCAVPEQEVHGVPMTQFQQPPTFTPGFAPYPYPMMPNMMMPNNMQGQQFPHHVMFGQQPVFYTYAPQTPGEEKL